MLKLLVIVACVSFAIGASASFSKTFRAGFFSPLVNRGGLKWADHLIGLALTCAFVAITLATARTLGFMRDEGMYFDAAKSYAGWFDKLLSKDPVVHESAFKREVVDAHWAPNAEHPSLMKSLFALSWTYFWKQWPQGLIELFHRHWYTRPFEWLVQLAAKISPKLFSEESDSFRFPGMVAGGLILWITYLFGAELLGRAGGIAAALFYAALPRPFFDAHLAAFDAGAVLAWLGVAYTYWKGLKSFGWAVTAGFAWGLALLTKHNSWFLPAVLLLHYAWLAFDMLRKRAGSPPTFTARLKTLPVPWPFLFMGMIGPAIFIYGWPRLWFDTWERIDWYFTFHRKHEYYNIEYLHHTYFQPPFPISMPYVLVLATVPLALLVAMVIGVFSRWRALLAPILPTQFLSPIRPDPRAPFAASTRDDDRRTAFFLFLNMNLPIALIAHPEVPHFGGTKHWHPAYPFVCLFAAMGVVFVASRAAALTTHVRYFVASRWRSIAYGFATIAIAALVFTPGAIETARSHPHGLSYYTPAVGGPAGGADLGLNRGFWGYETGAIVDWLNQHFPNGARVYPNDTFYSSWEELKVDGRLHANIDAEWWSQTGYDVAVIEHEQHMDDVEYQIWVALGTVTPAYIVTLEGVPTMTVYVNPKSKRYVP